MRRSAIFFGIFALAGCHHSSRSSRPGIDLDEAPLPHPYSKNPNASPLATITLTRHPGPKGHSYALTLGSAGTAVFVGGVRTSRHGKYVSTFDRSKFAGIVDLIQKSHFTDFDSYYGSPDNLVGVTSVSILWDGFRKSVVDRGGTGNAPPAALRQLEKTIETLVAHAKWELVKPYEQVPDFSPEFDTIPPRLK